MRTSYQDIKAKVIARIRAGDWPPGAAIPGEVELAETFGCARSTVSRAMRELVEAGLLERRRKAGTRVASSPVRKAALAIPLIRDEVEATGAAYRYALVAREIGAAPPWLAAQIALAAEASVLHLTCMHYADNRPYQFEDRWINLAAVPQAAEQDFQEIGPNAWLLQEVPFSEGELGLSAEAAGPDIAAFLDMQEGAPVFTLARTTWLEGVCVTYARLSFAQGYKMTTRF